MTEIAKPMIKLRIDNIEVEVEKGTTILEAAQSAGIKIPTLCHDRRLIPFGACRLCVVQEQGKAELLPSCFTPAKNGMNIITQSPKIFESRRLQLQLILLNHPMTCPRCEKEGECDLQSFVYEYGMKETIYPWEPIVFPGDDLSPILKRDSNKCILCGRCVRICDEVQGVGELSFSQRGIKTLVDTDFHRPIHCEFCGQCLDTCPVGAITSDRFDYSTKLWEQEETTAPCPYCSCGCLLTFGSKEGLVKRVFSEPEKGPNEGNLCVKGRFGWDFIDHPERLKTPLLRVNGTFKEASWDEALRWVAKEFEEIKAQEGPDAIAGMASDRLTNEEYYLFGKLFHEALGTNQISGSGDRAVEGLTQGLEKTLGMAASTSSIREIRKADCIVLLGVDPAHTHPIIRNEIHSAIRKNRTHVIVLGSHDIGLSQSTQVSPLSPPMVLLLGNPGDEVALLNGMIGTILGEGWEDKGYIEERTEGIEALREKQTGYSNLFDGEKKAELERAARIYAQSKKAMILIGSGLWSHINQKELAIASSNLSLITGHIGKESCGILVLLEKCNSQGAIDLGIFSGAVADGKMDLLQKAAEGKLKALYLVGEDPSTLSSDRFEKAMDSLRFLVVQDLFMTETAKKAHVVLPACAFVEKQGTFTNLERRIQRLSPLRPPLGQSKSDFEIFLQLLHILESPVSGETPEAIFEAIRLSVPYYKDVQKEGQWPDGLPYLYAEGFPKGKAKLIPLAQPQPKPQADNYPLFLIQRPSLFQSGLLSLKSDTLKIVAEKPCLEMNIEDARRLHIEEGETIQISTQEGQALRMKVNCSSKLGSGVITIPFPCPVIDKTGRTPVKVERLKGK